MKISEDSAGYQSEFRLGNGDNQRVNTMTIRMDENRSLLVTNTLDAVLPLGAPVYGAGAAALLILAGFAGAAVLEWKRRTGKRS